MPSIGKMAAQMTLDSSQFTAGLQKGSQELSKFSGNVTSNFDVVNASAEKATSGLNLGSKAIRNIGKAAGSAGVLIAEFSDSNTKLGKSLGALSAAGLFAATGNWLLALVFGLKAAITLLGSEETALDAVRNAATEAFTAVATGAKSASEALGELQIKQIEEGLTKLTVGLAATMEEFKGGFSTIFGGDITDTITRGIDATIEAADRARRIFEHLRAHPRYPEIEALGRGVRAEAALDRLRDEISLRGRLIGLTEDQARVERIRRDLAGGPVADVGSYAGSLLARLMSGGDLTRIGGRDFFADQVLSMIKWQDEIKKSNAAFQDFVSSIMNDIDALATPWDRAEEAIRRYTLAFELGVIEDEETYDRLLANVLDKLDQTTRLQQAAAPAALAAGSQAAYSAFNDIQRQQMGGSQADRLLRAAEREAESQERTLNESRRTRQILEDRLPQLGLAR